MPGELVTSTACTKEQSCQLQGHFSLWCTRCLLGLASKPGGEALAEAAVVSRGIVSNKLDQRLPRGCLSLCLGGCHHFPHCPDLKLALQTCPVGPFAAKVAFSGPFPSSLGPRKPAVASCQSPGSRNCTS